MPNNPELTALLAGARVVSIPMRVKFRGILHREALLIEGPAGWGEFAPFPEYSDAEASPWLASALEAAWQGYPAAVRKSIPVNGTVPAVAAARTSTVPAAAITGTSCVESPRF